MNSAGGRRPAVTDPHPRLIVFTRRLGTVEDDRGRECSVIAELVVSHRRAARAFTASLRHGVQLPHAGTRYRYRLDEPSWSISQPIAHYSRPRLLAYAAHALAELRTTDPTGIAYAFHIPGDHT